MVLKTPVGDVKLDQNRQAIGTTFVTEVVKDAQGNLYNKVLKKIDKREPDARPVAGRVQSRFTRRAELSVMIAAGSLGRPSGADAPRRQT